MRMPSYRHYLILPNYSSSRGGPGTFYRRFEKFFQSFYNLHSTPVFKSDLEFLLIINGTRRLDILFRALFYRISITTRLGSYYRSNILTDKTLKARIVHAFRTLLVIISLLVSSKVIFQSDTVRDEWTTSFLAFLFYKKDLFTIYNCVPDRVTGSYIYDYSSDDQISLVSLEANHCPLVSSFPFYLFNELNKSGIKSTLHVFGNLCSDDIDLLRLHNHNIYVHGFFPLDRVRSIVSNLKNPLYVVEDNFPCGCPNSMLEMQGLGIPSVALDHSVASELIKKFETGLIVPTTKHNLITGNFPVFNPQLFITQLSKSYNLLSSNCYHMSTALSPDFVFNAYRKAILGN